MFPMNDEVYKEVGKTSGAVNPQIGAFEVTMATNATIGASAGVLGKPFYFQRGSAGGASASRHNSFYNSQGGRNAQIFKYLKKLTIAIPPGYPELKPDFNTFGKKYPGPNGTQGNNPLPDATRSNFDSSDRTQIVLMMLDLLRSSNMAPGYLESGKSYDGGGGQVAGICGCNQIKPSDVQRGHTAALLINPAKPTIYTPKGSGRTYGPAEICLFAHVIATKREGQGQQGTVIAPQNATMATRWNEAKVASLVQVGAIINSFSPRHGWPPPTALSKLRSALPTATPKAPSTSAATATVPALPPSMVAIRPLPSLPVSSPGPASPDRGFPPAGPSPPLTPSSMKEPVPEAPIPSRYS
jgi:hypothetical protein